MAGIDVSKIKQDFPILNRVINGKRLVYLDSAATSQKPKQVIEKIKDYYENYNANIHRGIYKISEEATEAYIDSKRAASKFINSSSYNEIIYTKNATDSINLVALSWGEQNIKSGDHIMISEMEHHSNIVPWQMLAKRKGAVLDFVRVNDDLTSLDKDSLVENLDKCPKIVALTQVSNVLGTINDIREISREAHSRGAMVLVDGAQSTPHMPVDVKDLGADFFVASSHKMLGPAGLGILYASSKVLEEMPPLIGGGDMILTVEKERSTWNTIPWKFEAGTANIEGGIGFGAAIEYLNSVGMSRIREHEKEITRYALEMIEGIKNVRAYGYPANNIKDKAGVISFTIDGVHPHDVATIFDSDGVAIRAGHHCAMPLVKSVLHLPAVSRMSFYIYNDERDVDAAVEAIKKTKRVFKKV